MRELTEEEREKFEHIIGLKFQNNRGYFKVRYKGKNYKRSRIKMQLYLNKKLDLWEVVHHKDEDSSNDDIENLKVMSTEEHTSHHHAGKRRKSTKQLK